MGEEEIIEGTERDGVISLMLHIIIVIVAEVVKYKRLSYAQSRSHTHATYTYVLPIRSVSIGQFCGFAFRSV